MHLRAAVALVTVALAGCGGDDPATTPGPTGTSSAATASGGTTTTRPGAAVATGPVPATPAEVAATPSGIVPAGPAAESRDETVLRELRDRLARSPDALRRVGTARYRLDLVALGDRVRGRGGADFRSSESLGTIEAGGRELAYYNDGVRSYTRLSSGEDWEPSTSIVPNAPGNSTAVFAGQIRVARAGATETIRGSACRWAAGVVPLRAILRDAGALDTAEARNLLRVAKQDAAYPTGVCVTADGRILEVRYAARFDRDLGIPGAQGRQGFEGTIRFSSFGRGPAVQRPRDVPAG